MQIPTGRFGALHIVEVGAGDAGDFGEVARDVFGHGGLLFRGGGDLAVHVANRFHRLGDAFQHGAGLGHLLDTFFTARLPAFDGLGRVHCASLHGLDNLIDLDDR